MNISWILSVIALVLAILSLIGMAGFAALPLAVLCLALAHVLPGLPARVTRWYRTCERCFAICYL
jgi:hypothetical protein